MEIRDLYDENRNLTGETIFKGEELPEGRYILVVIVFIENSEGKYLIQKRSEIKDGKFASTGGHPKSGETSLEGILTEVKEEISLDLNTKDLILYNSGKFEGKRVFCDSYYIKLDIEDITKLKLQEEEVEYIEWMSQEEIENLMNQGLFLDSHYNQFKELLKWKNKIDKN